MKTLAILFTSFALVSSVLAGTATYDTSKSVSQPAPAPTCQCFGPGLSLGIYGGGFFPKDGGRGYDDAAGGGVLIEYFFTENIGIQGSYGVYGTSGGEHLFNGDIVLRAPIHSICLAPYILVGGGADVDGSCLGEWHAGAGLEARFDSLNCLGIFADGTYNWHNSSDRDYTQVRVGLKFRL